MAVKKNRRGLGRGLSALIQNTEESSAAERPEDVEEVEDTSPLEAETEQPPQREAAVLGGNVPAQGESLVNAESEAGGGAAAEPATESAPESKGTSVSDRYLKSSGRTSEAPVARETRRPVDVFFPPLSDEDRSHAETPSPAEGRGRRRTMPGVTDHRTRSSVAADALLSGTPQRRTQSSPVDDGDSASAGQSAESSRSGVLPDGSELRLVPVAEIHPNPRQPRDVFDEDDMDELVASIREVGVLQPVVVRPVEADTFYELVMGERRWRASQHAGLSEIPAIVRHTSDEDLLRDALLENLHRSQLNPLEEAAAYQQLLEDFDCTQEELSARIGRSRPQISNTLRLMKLPPLVQRRVASGVLSAGHARALLSLSDPADMERLAQKIVSEGMSVRATEELVAMESGMRQPKAPQRARTTQRHERLDYWANSLTDELDTTVKITLGARKGKIAIDFASVEDLHRIMGLIQPSSRQPESD